MTPIDSILARVDFDSAAGEREHALDRAALLAAELGSRLLLLHVRASTRRSRWLRWLGRRPPRSRSLAELRAALSAAVERITDTCVVEADFELRTGDAVDQACLAAARSGLLVVNAGLPRRRRELWFGTAAERLLEQSPRPVLFAKRPALEPYRRVLLACDLSPSSAQGLRLAASLAPQAELHLVHALPVAHEAEMRLAGLRESVIHRQRRSARQAAHAALLAIAAPLGEGVAERLRPAVLHGDARRLLLEREESLDADLVVIGRPRGGTSPARPLDGLAARLLGSSGCDLLSVPLTPRAVAEVSPLRSAQTVSLSDVPIKHA